MNVPGIQNEVRNNQTHQFFIRDVQVTLTMNQQETFTLLSLRQIILKDRLNVMHMMN